MACSRKLQQTDPVDAFEVPLALPVCQHHPGVKAVCFCARCQAPICATCGFPQSDGNQWCPACAAGLMRGDPASRQPLAPAEPPACRPASGQMCARHPALPATARCKLCGAGVCTTCDFVFPGNLHVCPTCATKSQTSLSPRRKTFVLWALGLAGWCTLGLALLFSGVFKNMVTTSAEQEAFGLLIFVVIFIPSIVGFGMSLAARDRRLKTPPLVVGAIIWNSILLAVLLLLTIVGNLS